MVTSFELKLILGFSLCLFVAVRRGLLRAVVTKQINYQHEKTKTTEKL